MGSLLSGTKSWGTLDNLGKEGTCKCFGCQICNFGFHSHASKCEINSYLNEQHSCPFLFSKNGEVWEKYGSQGDHDYYREPPLISEQGSRFSVQNCEGFKPVKVKTSNILIHLPRMEKAKHRLFCFTGASPVTSLFVMETRSIKQKLGCISYLLGTPKRVPFPTILTYRSCIK